MRLLRRKRGVGEGKRDIPALGVGRKTGSFGGHKIISCFGELARSLANIATLGKQRRVMRVVGQCICRDLIGLYKMACIGKSIDEQPTICLVAGCQRHRPASRRHSRGVIALRLQFVGGVCRPVRLLPHICLDSLFSRLQQLAILGVLRGEGYRFACTPNRFGVVAAGIRFIRCVRRIVGGCRRYDGGIYTGRLRFSCSGDADQGRHK